MQQEAHDEDEAFTIRGVKIEGNEIVYGIKFDDDPSNTAIEWIPRCRPPYPACLDPFSLAVLNAGKRFTKQGR
jgi:hypothetical protein